MEVEPSNLTREYYGTQDNHWARDILYEPLVTVSPRVPGLGPPRGGLVSQPGGNGTATRPDRAHCLTIEPTPLVTALP